jgi:hypothetical protein
MSMILTVAATIAAFNLACSGMAQFTDPAGKTSQRAYSERYRVDPAHHLFCSGACKSPNSLSSISDAMVVFYDFRDGDDVARETFDRKSGAHSVEARKIGSKMRFSRIGTCTVQPFTGFAGVAG